MSEKIRPEHLQREAIVYIRQSSLGQVKNHRESRRVQERLVARARTLGWTQDKIHVVDHWDAKKERAFLNKNLTP